MDNSGRSDDREWRRLDCGGKREVVKSDDSDLKLFLSSHRGHMTVNLKRIPFLFQPTKVPLFPFDQSTTFRPTTISNYRHPF